MNWSDRLGSSAPSHQARQIVNHRRPKPQQPAYSNQPPRPQTQSGFRAQRPPQQRQPQPPQRPPQRDWQAELDQQLTANGERIAKIRGVRSGNTLRIQYHQMPTETNVMLDGVRAPRLSSRNNPAEDFFAFEAKEFLRKRVIGAYARVKEITPKDRGTNSTGNFPSNLVRIQIPSSEPTKLYEGNCKSWVDLGVMLCEDGYGECSVNNHNAHDYYVKLENAINSAKEQQKGKWGNLTPEEMQNTIRDFEDDREGGETVLEEIFDKYKGVEIPAVIDDVVEGSTLRVELHLHELEKCAHPIVRNVRLYCMGARCKRVHPPQVNQEQNYQRRNGSLNGFQLLQSEPVALEAKNFMKVRLSHRDVFINVRFIDTGRLYGSIRLPNGFDPARNLLARGYAETDWGLTDLPEQEQEQYIAAQESAQANGLGLWRNESAPKRVARKRGKMANTHLVTKVFSGDSLEVFDDGVTKRVFLASTNCPRLAPRGKAARRPGALQADEKGAWAAKEFTRSALIGKQIMLQTEYSRTNQTGGAEREYVTVHYQDDDGNTKDLTAELIKHGFAKLVKHRAEDSRASGYVKYKTLEEEAIKKQVGIHNDSKSLLTPKVKDYKQTRNPYNQITKFLVGDLGLTHINRNMNRKDRDTKKQSQRMRATIEYVAGCSRYVILLKYDDCLHKFSFNLSGIRSVTDRDASQANLQGDDEKLMNRQLTEQATKVVRNMIQQKDVWITIDDLSRNGNVLGQVYTMEKQESISYHLLECGFAKINDRAAQYLPFKKALKEHEERAQNERVGIWENWVPPPEAEPEDEQMVMDAQPEEAAEDTAVVQEVVVQRQLTGTLGDVEDSATVWIIEKNQERQGEIEAYMSSVDINTVNFDGFEPDKKGTKSVDNNKHRIVGGLFEDGNYYRFKINKVRRKTKKGTEVEFIGVFIDFGTRSTLDYAKLIPIEDEEVRNYRSLAKRYRLCALKAPPVKSEEFRAAGMALYDVLANGDIDVTVMAPPKGGVTEAELSINGRSVNVMMLNSGYCRMENKDRKRLAILDNYPEKKDTYQKASNKAEAGHKGMFRHGAVDSGDEEEDTGRRRRRNRRNR